MDWFLYDIGLRHERVNDLFPHLHLVRLAQCQWKTSKVFMKVIETFIDPLPKKQYVKKKKV